MLRTLLTDIAVCELKFDDESEPGHFKGYASKFDGNDSFDDTILPGAYKQTIKRKRSPHMFINHLSREIPVGDWLKLEEDKVGLIVEGLIDFNHLQGTSLHSAMKRKAMSGLSIGYNIPKGGSEPKNPEEPWAGRIISKIDLIEISVVTRPADDKARISQVKTEIDSIENLRDCELFLRDAGGLSRSMAVAFVGQFKAICQSDSDEDAIARITEAATKKKTTQIIELINKL